MAPLVDFKDMLICFPGRDALSPSASGVVIALCDYPLLRDNKELNHHLELPDDGVLIDMDTPEDYRRIAAMHRPGTKDWGYGAAV